MKKRSLFTTAILVGTIVLGAERAIAGHVKPTPVRCYFFKQETPNIQNTCTFEGWSWAGGGGSSLTWKDGITTKIQFGLLQGHGERVCPEGQMAVDGVCGKIYARSPNTLKRISNNNEPAMTCVQLNKKSVCWKF